MKKQKRYIIDDLKDFTQTTRMLVVESFFDNEYKDKKDPFNDLFKTKKNKLEEKLTIDEASSIVESMIEKKSNEYLLSNKIFENIVDSLNRRLISNLLLELSKEGLVESAFDEELNDFIFWPKNQPK